MGSQAGRQAGVQTDKRRMQAEPAKTRQSQPYVQLDDMTHVLTVLYCGHRPDNHGHDVRLDDCGFTIQYCGHRPDNHGHDVRLDDCGFTILYCGH